MPAVNSYLHRVQQALHELVVNHQLDVTLDLLRIRAIGFIDGLNARYRSRAESRLNAVLKREVRARRITIDHAQSPTIISVTSDGKTFYRAFGSDPVYEADDPRLMRLTISQLDRLSAGFKRVLQDVQQTFLEYYPDNTDAKDLTTLPNAIIDFYDTFSNLEHSNSEMQLEMNYEEGRLRQLRHSQGAADPNSMAAPTTSTAAAADFDTAAAPNV